MASNDADAVFWGLLAEHHAFLVRVAVGTFHISKSDGEDLAQETLMRAFEARASFIHGSNLKAWLATILRNYKISQARRAWRLSFTDVLPEIPTSGDAAYHSLLLKQTISAMATMPQDHIDAIVRATRGHTLSDTAEALSMVEGTVKSRTSRARKALSELME